MNVSQFAESHGQEAKTVRAYIRRHKEEFEPIITRKVNEIELSEQAYIKLEEIYKPPKPVIYKDSIETMQELERLKEQNKKLVDELLKASCRADDNKSNLIELAEINGRCKLIEEQSKEKEEKLQKLIKENTEQVAKLQIMEQKAAEQEKTLKELAIERATNKESREELEKKSKELEEKLQELEEAKQTIAELEKKKGFIYRLFNK